MTFGKQAPCEPATASEWYYGTRIDGDLFGIKFGSLYYTPGETVDRIVVTAKNIVGWDLSQPWIRGLIYNEAGVLLAVTEQKQLLHTPEDDTMNWRELIIIDPNTGTHSSVTLPAGNYYLCCHVGGYGAIRTLGAYDGQGFKNNDVYDDGASDPLDNPDQTSNHETNVHSHCIYAALGGEPHGPTAKFTVDPLPASPNVEITFDATDSLSGWTGEAISEIEWYIWDFGDGTVIEGPRATHEIVTHRYATEGDYNVSLTVRDGQPLEDTMTALLHVYGELTTFEVGFEQIDPDFKVGREGKVDTRTNCNLVNCGPFVYWNRGGNRLNVYPDEMEFVPTEAGEPVHSGTQAARLRIIVPNEGSRRIEVLHDWNALTAEHIWIEQWINVPADLPWTNPATGKGLFYAIHRIIYERLWSTYLPMRAQQHQIDLSIKWNGLLGKPVFGLKPGPSWVDNNDDGVSDIPQHDFEEKYFELGPEGVPKEQWIHIKTHVYRNLTNPPTSYGQGYVEVWINGQLAFDVNPAQTVGIAPERIESAQFPPSCHEPGLEGNCAWLCSGFGLYEGPPDSLLPATLYADDVKLSFTGGVAYSLTVATEDPAKGTTSPAPGVYQIPEGETRTFTAVPNTQEGWFFDHWELDGTPIGQPGDPAITIISAPEINGKTLMAFFDVTPPNQWCITVIAALGGTTNPTGTRCIDEGVDLTVTATSSAGYEFNHWELDSVNIGSDNPVTIPAQPVGSAHVLLAVFTTPKPFRCFIATVAYDSPYASELNVLRRFRDQCLPFQLVSIYYTVGPYLAKFIKGRKAIKRYVKEALNLFVRLYKGVKW